MKNKVHHTSSKSYSKFQNESCKDEGEVDFCKKLNEKKCKKEKNWSVCKKTCNKCDQETEKSQSGTAELVSR